jgi:hypothetical protein
MVRNYIKMLNIPTCQLLFVSYFFILVFALKYFRILQASFQYGSFYINVSIWVLLCSAKLKTSDELERIRKKSVVV